MQLIFNSLGFEKRPVTSPFEAGLLKTSRNSRSTLIGGTCKFIKPLLFIAGTFGIAVSLAAQTPDMYQAILPEVVVATTVPASGDLNPYGTAFVPPNFPSSVLNAGDVLVSNYNNAGNLQGTGGSIVRITPTGQTSLFFQGTGIGFSGALGFLSRGFILAGSVPTADGTSNTVSAGGLLIFDANGNFLRELTDPVFLDGPWGLAVNDHFTTAQVFISNVLNGTVVRLNMAGSTVTGMSTIASGYPHRTDPAAIVLGPSGVAYNQRTDTLYVASQLENSVYAIYNASTTSNNGPGRVIYHDDVHLHAPLDLVITPEENLITANADGFNVDPNQPSELVEFTKYGQFLRQTSVDKANGGAFGVALFTKYSQTKIAAVDDNAASLTIWTVPTYPRF